MGIKIPDLTAGECYARISDVWVHGEYTQNPDKSLYYVRLLIRDLPQNIQDEIIYNSQYPEYCGLIFRAGDDDLIIVDWQWWREGYI